MRAIHDNRSRLLASTSQTAIAGCGILGSKYLELRPSTVAGMVQAKAEDTPLDVSIDLEPSAGTPIQ